MDLYDSGYNAGYALGSGIFGLLFLLLMIGYLVVFIMHCVSMQSALEAVPQPLRRMSPGNVWLRFIPLFWLAWQFIVVNAVADSLRAEFARRNLPREEDRPGAGIGIASCVLLCCMIIPWLGFITMLIGIILRIVHMQKINRHKQMLAAAGFYPWQPGHEVYGSGNIPPYTPNYNQQHFNPPYSGQQGNYNQSYNPQQPNYDSSQQFSNPPPPPADPNDHSRWMPGSGNPPDLNNGGSNNTNSGGNNFWEPPPTPPVPPVPPAS